MKKKLYRSADDKVLAGVLGGLAEYYGNDSVFWRLGAIILFILTGLMPGTLVYIIAALIIPLRPRVEYTVEDGAA